MQHKEPTVSLGIAEALAQVAIEASDEPDLPRTLERIVHGAATTVPAADHAHLATVQGKQAHIMAATAPAIAALAETMYRLGEGPGPTAIHDERIILVTDLRNDTRWPTFTTEAVKQGIRSMMSLPLRPTNRPVIGSLSLYSPKSHAFDTEAEHIAQLFAIHATVVLAGELGQTQLHNALTSRDLIGTAKGILMQQRTCTEDQAFQLLSAASQRANTKLRDVAAWIVTDANNRAHPQ